MNLAALGKGDLVAAYHDPHGERRHLESLCVLRRRVMVDLLSGLEFWRVKFLLRGGMSRTVGRWVSREDRRKFYPAARLKHEEQSCGAHGVLA